MERQSILVIRYGQRKATAGHLCGISRRHCLEDAVPVLLPDDSKCDILSPVAGGQEGTTHA